MMGRPRTMRDIWSEQRRQSNGDLSELARRLAKLQQRLSETSDGRHGSEYADRHDTGNISIGDLGRPIRSDHRQSSEPRYRVISPRRQKEKVLPYEPETQISCEELESHENPDGLLMILRIIGISMIPSSKFIRSNNDYGEGNVVFWTSASPHNIILATLYDIFELTVLEKGQRYMKDRGVYSKEEYIESLGKLYDPMTMSPSTSADGRMILVRYGLCHNEK